MDPGIVLSAANAAQTRDKRQRVQDKGVVLFSPADQRSWLDWTRRGIQRHANPNLLSIERQYFVGFGDSQVPTGTVLPEGLLKELKRHRAYRLPISMERHKTGDFGGDERRDPHSQHKGNIKVAGV